ncbi:glycoside hydrolase family 97 protein [Gilvimarinus sp. SDUM040013]|uniref:Glycoside hydrolase family 97 protein n=1 Tax=Gilvimarinus gilvus TaxID=3058038 RepID=A0ABU4RVX2_9GAMM|nr:glycoside hydrolase family 97 protein [Gilvimarinus sp. SDUM040013]MDO3387835.1 glycoside hydrolase family 97 protein [Gilvimarinus sp. SDUM040013]MDX6848794.1 glycoside hydrolase family 97 protein [Gilvimarinus sp. SDUM040013]
MNWLFFPTRLAALALVATAFAALSFNAYADTYTLNSPDGQLSVNIDTERELSFSVTLGDIDVIAPSTIGLDIAGMGDIADKITVTTQASTRVQTQHTPIVAHKNSTIAEHYQALTLSFANQFGIEFRAFNDGMAYRFWGNYPHDIKVLSEQMSLNFPAMTTTLFPEEETLISHYERLYVADALAQIEAGRFASLPVYFEANDVNVLFTEADVFDYPGLFIDATGTDSVKAKHPGVVTKATPTPGSEDRNQQLTFADHIAETTGQRKFPWRVAMINKSDAKLVESELVWLLSRENQLADTDWIKPGRIAWDWYNANNLFGVDFEAGLNTQTYKYYIDFAAEHGLEYVILDEGWTKSTTNIIDNNPDMDVKELIRYGKEKGVGIILWALWGPLDQDYKNILKTYGEWGAAGIKIDFMQRADQYMVNYYEKIAREAARHHLLVDYHGGFKPTGLRRTFPNVMTYEGVKGNENNKWSQDITPEHTVTLPFTRMLAGPMDFTPGALRNAHLPQHHVSHFRPVALGTRAHQVAMYAVYESALQMLCESPTTYQKEPQITEFIAQFPSVWDETRVLDASVADYILVARRHGDKWYLGAMTDDTARTLNVNFDFLGAGEYTLDLVRDGLNTQHYAEDYKREQRSITAGETLQVRLASGGGWAGVVSKR